MDKFELLAFKIKHLQKQMHQFRKDAILIMAKIKNS